ALLLQPSAQAGVHEERGHQPASLVLRRRLSPLSARAFTQRVPARIRRLGAALVRRDSAARRSRPDREARLVLPQVATQARRATARARGLQAPGARRDPVLPAAPG